MPYMEAHIRTQAMNLQHGTITTIKDPRKRTAGTLLGDERDPGPSTKKTSTLTPPFSTVPKPRQEKITSKHHKMTVACMASAKPEVILPPES